MEALLVDRDLCHMIEEDKPKENSKGKSKEDKAKESTST